MKIEIKNLHKKYGTFQALQEVSLSIRQGEVIAIIGPSGSGKSTLLRMINGLDSYDAGSIHAEGVRLDSKDVGMVFQGFNLFPHLTILENLTVAPRRVMGQPKAEAETLARELLRSVGIQEQEKKYPSQLSGGQQQRAAIARALAMKPKLMLFDEPTSSLDPENTVEVLDTMRTLALTGMTMIVVTHSMGFAKQIAQRVLYMDSGEILEDASPEKLFQSPTHPKTQAFLAKTLKY